MPAVTIDTLLLVLPIIVVDDRSLKFTKRSSADRLLPLSAPVHSSGSVVKKAKLKWSVVVVLYRSSMPCLLDHTTLSQRGNLETIRVLVTAARHLELERNRLSSVDPLRRGRTGTSLPLVNLPVQGGSRSSGA
jgi:hypothetical protein